MNRALLDVITWTIIGTTVACTLLLAAAVDDLDPAARPLPGRVDAPPTSPALPVGQLERDRAQTPSAPTPVRLADRS